MNPASTALVDHHLREIRTQLTLSGPGRSELSLGRLLRGMVNYGPGDSGSAARDEWRASDANAERLTSELTGVAGFTTTVGDRGTALIDWDWLRSEAATRAMSVVPGSKGGYAVGVEAMPAVDPLWQDSIVGATGVQVLANLTSNATIPRGTGGLTTTWQAADGTSVTAVDAALGSASITQKTVIALVQCSLQLLRQAASVQDFLVRLLLRSVRAAIDNALLQGVGSGGQPIGLATLPTATGIQQISGGSLTWANVLNAQRLCSASGVPDWAMSWVGAPTVRETLAAREKISTSGRFIWDDGKIANNPAFATPDAPASTLFVGAFGKAVAAFFGPGIEITSDTSGANFTAGMVTFRVMAMCDIVFPQPAAFVRITGVS